MTNAGHKLSDYDYEAIPSRAIREDTCRKFGYLVGPGDAHAATLVDSNGKTIAWKYRGADKSFWWEGERTGTQLFGQHLWNGGPRLVVTEGEIDCLSVSQVFGNKWPVVSITKGCNGALRELSEHVEWLENFERIILFFDNDEAGIEATRVVCEGLPVTPGKLHVARLVEYKDANEALVAGNSDAITQAYWRATPYVPGGIVNLADTWDLVSQEPEDGHSYPWHSLTEYLHGQRSKELVTWVAGSGVGKSQFVREVAYHLGIRLGKTIGYIALEESLRTTSLGFLSRHLGRRLHFPRVYSDTSTEELKKAFDETLGKGNIYADTHFGSTDTLLPKLRYLIAANKCEFLFIDHISIMVSGMATEGNEREKLDTFTTGLRKLSEQTGVGIHLVSHLRRVQGKTYEEGSQISLGDIRGTGAIGQLSDIVIGLERNQQSPDEGNITTIRVVKNRFSGDTGEVCKVKYFEESGILKEDVTSEF